MQVSPFSSVAAGDSCGRCLHWLSEWRVAALDGRAMQEDWAAQSQGASSVPDPAAPALPVVSFPPPMILTISSPAVCLINLLLTILVTLSLLPPNPAKAPSPPTPAGTHSGFGSSTLLNAPLSPGRVTPPWLRLLQTFLKNSWTRPPYRWEPDSGPQTAPTEGFPAAGGCRAGLAAWLAPPSPLQSDSVLPECSTTLKRLERPSVRPFRTGLSLVVVERAQAEPPPPLMGLCWRLHRLRSLEEEVPSNLEVEPEDTLRCSFGDPYFGEQHGLSMRL